MNMGAYFHIAPRLKTCFQENNRSSPHQASCDLRRACWGTLPWQALRRAVRPADPLLGAGAVGLPGHRLRGHPQAAAGEAGQGRPQPGLQGLRPARGSRQQSADCVYQKRAAGPRS